MSPVLDNVAQAGRGRPDLLRLNTLLLHLYDQPHGTRAGWWSCIEHLRKHFGAEQAAFIIRRRLSGDPTELIISGEEPCPEARQMFLDRYSAIDPFSNLPPERACTVQDILSPDEWRASEFFRKYLSPQRLVQVMGADIDISRERVMAFRICRSPGAGEFSDQDREEFQFLLPHLRRIAETRIRHSTLEASDRIFTDLLDCMELGAIVLDQAGEVLKINPTAERMLARREGVTLANGALRALNAEDNRHFLKLIRQALASSRQGGELIGTIGLKRRENEQLLGVAVRSLASEGAVTGIRQATVAVLLGGGRGHEHISESALKSLFSLTNAETRLAIALMRGATIDEVAGQMGVSRNTIRTHLNGLFLKTGTNRQSEVIRALLGSIASIC